jgi:colanic acid biosynthesis glycosyl transferase WcaI
VDAAFELGLLPAQGPIHDAALRIEKFFTFAFDRVSGVSARMVDRARAKGIPDDRAVLFPNWVDVDTIYPLDPAANRSNPFRREFASRVPGIEDKIILLYSGNMGAKQGLELLAPLAESFAADPRVHFVFCGDGIFRARLEALVSDRPNVTLLPLQPHDRLNDLLNSADIHLLPQRASAADLVMPSRLSAMLSSGRPVIATAHPGTQVAQVVEGRDWLFRRRTPPHCAPQSCFWSKTRSCVSVLAVPHASMLWHIWESSRSSISLSLIFWGWPGARSAFARRPPAASIARGLPRLVLKSPRIK